MISDAVKELQITKKKYLEQINGLQAQVQKIDSALAALSGIAVGSRASTPAKGKRKGKMSAAGRQAIAAAVKARWAKIKADAVSVAPAAKSAKKKYVMSPAHKAALKKAQAARWAKHNAAKKK